MPVDYVAAAMDHIAHQPGLDGQAFHLMASKSQRSGDVLNTFARAAPRAAHGDPHRQAPDRRAAQGRAARCCCSSRRSRACAAQILADLGIPEEILGHLGFTAQFDTRDTERALAGTGIEVPPLDSYAEPLWDYWERKLDPDLYKDRSFERGDQRAHGRHHRRLERHRARRRA